jgi:hypothetical protein
MHSPDQSKHCSRYSKALLLLFQSNNLDATKHSFSHSNALLVCPKWLLSDLKSTIQQFYVCINYFAICLKVEKEHISICLFAQFLVSLHQFFTGGRKQGRLNQVNRLSNRVDCRPNGAKSKTKQ